MAGYIGSRISNSVVTLDGVTISSATKFQPFIGSIAPFAMATAPSGWLVCNGAEYAIADYGDLYGAISTTWGALTDGSGSSGTTHFVVPDLRGEFLRGFDNGAGRDPDSSSRFGGDAVGSQQPHAFESHGHNIMGADSTAIPDWFGGSGANYGMVTSGGFLYGSYVKNTGGSETRPRNLNVQYCIKF